METLIAQTREGIGKEAAKKIRNTGSIPAVLYGHNCEKAVSVSLGYRNVEKALDNPKGQNIYLELELDGKVHEQRVLIRELQRHPVSRRILHVDLVVPHPEKELVSTIPLTFVGRSIGVQMGGRIRKPYREVRVKSLPEQIPAEIVVDITPLDQGDMIYASNLEIDKAQVLYDQDYVVVKVVAPRGKATT